MGFLGFGDLSSGSVFLVHFVIQSFTVTGYLNGQELHPEDEDRVVGGELLAGIRSHQCAIGIIFHLVELFGKLPPFELLQCGLQDVIAEETDLKIRKVLSEGGVDLVVVRGKI